MNFSVRSEEGGGGGGGKGVSEGGREDKECMFTSSTHQLVQSVRVGVWAGGCLSVCLSVSVNLSVCVRVGRRWGQMGMG